MFKRSFIGFAAVAAVVLTLSAGAFGQIYITSGKVELLKDDNTRQPVADAVIDIYRTDAKGGFPQTKTSKRGEWSVAGFQPGAIYALAISAPGCSPLVAPGIRAGQEKLVITLRPGDGRRLTEEEARNQLKGAIVNGAATAPDGAASGEPQMSEEDKKKKAEYDAEVARINKKNEENKTKFETVVKLLNEGQEAQKAGNIDLAISKFDEGYKADPEFAGTAPTLLVRLAEAQKARAVATNNKAASTTDATEKVEKLGQARKDLGDSMASFKTALEVQAKANPGDVSPENAAKIKSGALAGMKEIMRIAGVVKQVDERVMAIGKEMLNEIVAADADVNAKTDTKLYYASLFLALGDADGSVAAYRDVLAGSPENVDGLIGLGLSLVNAGFINNNKEQLQEGANALQRFVSLAPAGHKFKTDAEETLAVLKKESNVAPQKGGPAPKKKP